jgi:hypothetical protein
VCVSCPDQHVEHGDEVTGELLAVGGQGDQLVRAGAQQRGAGDGFELADLAGQDGVPGAEVPGGVVKAGMPAGCQEPADALFGVRAGEDVPDRWRECGGSAEAGQRVVAAVDAVPDRDAGGAGCGGEGSGRDAGSGGDVFEAAAPCLVLLAQPVRVDVTAGGRGGLPEPGARPAAA